MVHFLDGRTLFSYRATVFAINTTPQKVLSANPNRWGVILSDSSGGQITFSFDQAIAGLVGHLYLGQATVSQPTLLNWDTIGPVILSTWFACRSLSGTSNLAVTEIIYQPPSA